MVEFTSSKPKPQEGVLLWLAKIVAGLAIIIVLSIHFVINHIVAPNGLLDYSDVLKYYSNPIIPVMEIFFLIIVVGHSLLGLRGILLDLNPSNKIRSIADCLFVIVGGVACVYGIWLVLVVIQAGKGV